MDKKPDKFKVEKEIKDSEKEKYKNKKAPKKILIRKKQNMENEKFAHMEPSKEILSLSMLEQVNLANNSGKPSGDFTKEIEYVQVVDDLIDIVQNPKEKIKVATGRKIGREKKTPMESLKVQHYKIKLGAKRDEVNFVEDILDKTRERTIPVKWNVAIMNLNPLGGNLIEEGILQENLRKIQGYK